jgi:undecaprenyl-diphosphatase
MRLPWLVVSAVGLAVLAASLAAARRPAISPLEARVFHAVNGLPNGLYWLLWPVMQLGNLVVGTVAGLLVAFFDHDLTVAVGVVLAMVLKLVAERIVRREMREALAIRQRPGTSQVGAIRRGGDVPESGPSFPSGHVILVAGVGTVVAPVFASTLWWVPALATLLVMLGRVYVGAHNPLDVTAGLGAGLLLGGVLASLVD